jgi:hypothetical protein
MGGRVFRRKEIEWGSGDTRIRRSCPVPISKVRIYDKDDRQSNGLNRNEGKKRERKDSGK